MRVMDPFLKDNPGAKRCSTAHFKEHAPDRIQPLFFKTPPPPNYTSARFWEGLVSCQVFNEIIQVRCHIFLFIVEEALPQQLSLAYLKM